MISFPNCKINLGLHVTARRADGYNDIESVFYPIALRDALEIVTTSTSIKLITTGIPVANDDSNLCSKAYEILKKDFPEIPSVEIHLHKAIPLGAGLGGGSADGSFALKMMKELFDLQLSEEQLIRYALQLGSDCPFFIINAPCFSKGRGEILSRVDVSLSGYTVVLINPGTHVDTGWAFGKVNPQLPSQLITDIIKQPIKEWKNNLINDFEVPVFESYPEIKNIKEKLYQQGAVYASMSGSGSTVYGLFEDNIELDKFGQYSLIKKIKLS